MKRIPVMRILSSVTVAALAVSAVSLAIVGFVAGEPRAVGVGITCLVMAVLSVYAGSTTATDKRERDIRSVAEILHRRDHWMLVRALGLGALGMLLAILWVGWWAELAMVAVHGKEGPLNSGGSEFEAFGGSWGFLAITGLILTGGTLFFIGAWRNLKREWKLLISVFRPLPGKALEAQLAQTYELDTYDLDTAMRKARSLTKDD